MAYFTTKDGVNLFYQDMGQGRPVVLVHGWSIPSDSWEYVLHDLLDKGLRCIVYDQRGCGKSDKPYQRYSLVQMAADLAELLETLKLEDVLLVGHSLGCSVVTRYLADHGQERIAKVVFLSTNTPYLRLAADNPAGFPPSFADEQIAAIKKDRAGFVRMIGGFYFSGSGQETVVSSELMNWTIDITMQASPFVAIDTIREQFEADLRGALQTIKRPVLLLHGAEDVNAPLALTSEQTLRYLPQGKLKVYPRGAHGFNITHAADICVDILAFLNNDTK
jgi:non-heme chloroperoxidase